MYNHPYRGQGNRGRGGSAGRGRGRGGMLHERFASDGVRFVLVSGGKGKLVPYSGLLEDVRLQAYKTYQLVPQKSSVRPADRSAPAAAAPLPEEQLSEVLQPEVRWKAQFGRQIVYFGCPGGLPAEMEDALAASAMDGARLTEVLNGPKRTSFTSETFPDVLSAVKLARKCFPIESEVVTHKLRVSEKAAYGGRQYFYERDGKSRSSVLAPEPFEAQAHLDEQRCANVVFLPPRKREDGRHGNYSLFRLQAIRPSERADRWRRIRVNTSGGRPDVTFVNDSALVSYVRVEERHVLKIRGAAAELHVVLGEEYGSTVPPKANPVRLELRQTVLPGPERQRRESWEKFVELGNQICERLAGAPGAGDEHEESDSSALGRCLGDSASSPCSNPRCALCHLYTVCIADAGLLCANPQCNYWHGFTEVQSLLTTVPCEYQLVPADFNAMRVGAQLWARLRAAVSLQLLRIREAASSRDFKEVGGKNGQSKRQPTDDQLGELVKQYNAVASRFFQGMPKDSGLYGRCCRRLKNPLPLLAAQDAVQDACRRHEKYVLVDSSTGSGKSTQLPQFLAEVAATQRGDGSGDVSERQKLVICVEPRALAAVSLADHVALEYEDPEFTNARHVFALTRQGEQLRPGGHIMYTTEHALQGLMRGKQVDFEKNVFAVILDEAHERSIAGDMLLGILKQEACRTNFAFQLVVCSATLQVSAFTNYLPGACRISVQSRLHPVEVVYRGVRDVVLSDVDYVQETVDAVVKLVEDPISCAVGNGASVRRGKHVLAFLPTAADVENARDLLAEYIREHPTAEETHQTQGSRVGNQWDAMRVYTISGRQAVEEQRLAFAEVERDQQKIIFATPVAETSITIDGVGYVVDCGLSRASQYDPVRHLTEMVVSQSTQSSAEQRAGRAGRTGPGVCVRLYTKANFALFAKDKSAAVKTAPLHIATLQLARMGYSMLDFDWIEKPSQEAVAATVAELTLHGAFADAAGVAINGRVKGETALSRFGQFLLNLEGTSVTMGKLLYEAEETGEDEFVALAALAAATVDRFPFLFFYPQGKKNDFFAQLRIAAEKYGAERYGDVVCAVQLIATALHDNPQQSGARGQRSSTVPGSEYIKRRVLNDIQQLQSTYYRAARVAGARGCLHAENTPLPSLSSDTILRYADKLYRAVARCLCQQVVVRRGDEEMRYRTLDGTNQDCLLADKSFLKQLCSVAASGSSGLARQRFRPGALPEICVFAHLLSFSTTRPAIVSLCTPVPTNLMPSAVQEKIAAARREQSVVRTLELPSVLIAEWSPRDLSAWLSHRLRGSTCSVTIDCITKVLSLSCSREHVRALSQLLTTAVAHARERHRATCYEVALNGFCRVTWKQGCERPQILRDKDEYVTLRVSGVCESDVKCLDLDLSALVEKWSERWFGRRMLVTVRSADGGAASASGVWTAFVTFEDAPSAHEFFSAFNVAAEEDRPFVKMEPFCEQEPLAPAANADAPACRINLRLYVGRVDPERTAAESERAGDYYLESVLEFQRLLSLALPHGAMVESRQIDQSQGLLLLQLLVTNPRVAEATLAALHRIRGSSLNFRPFFIHTAYNAEFPLPSLANKALQRLLIDSVTKAVERGERVAGAGFSCEAFTTIAHRSLMVRCNSPLQLQTALDYLREATQVRRFTFDLKERTEQVNAARKFAFELRYVVQQYNLQQQKRDAYVFECQFALREADEALCFIGSEKAFKSVEAFLATAKGLCRVECTTLTLPPPSGAARVCAQWVERLVQRCRSNRQPARRIRDYDSIVLIAPPEVVRQAKEDASVATLWRAIDGADNDRFAHALDETTAHRASLAAGADDAARRECAVCICDVRVENVRLLCGHQCCTECLAGAFDAEGGDVPGLPIRCVACGEPLSANEVCLYAPRIGLKRLAEALRTKMVTDTTRTGAELKACPNQLCTGVPKVLAYDKRQCSGCNLQFCEVCVGKGAVRGWHDGPHFSPAQILADDLAKQVTLLPQCPKCGCAFYDFFGCFAISCSNVAAPWGTHGFCGFCMKDCDADAHSHVLQCPRNPGKSFHAPLSAFFQCRSEDLARQLHELLAPHPALTPELVKAVCAKVKANMSDDWPKEPVEDVEKKLLESSAARKLLPGIAARAVKDDKKASDAARLDETENDSDRGTQLSAADAARRLVCQLSGTDTAAITLPSGCAGTLAEAVFALQGVCAVELSVFVDETVEAVGSDEEAAAIVYAFYDTERSLESMLRSAGCSPARLSRLIPFVWLLNRGLQLLQTHAPLKAVRVARLEAPQLAAYTSASVVVWNAPTVCTVPREQGRHEQVTSKEVMFVIQCFVYARCELPRTADAVRIILPAGCYLRVEKVQQRVVYLRQEADFNVEA